MTSLPSPGADSGTWGDELNTWLGVAHNADGTAKYQPWQFSVKDAAYGAKGDGQLIADATITSGALSTLTSATAGFTSADVGKPIVVAKAGGGTNTPLCTTISGYTSATQVTLTDAASGAVSGVGALYGTDDTAAIQAAVDDACAYAQVNPWTGGEVVLPGGIYCIGGAPGKVATLSGTSVDVGGNAQIRLPYVHDDTGPKVSLTFTGPCEAGGPQHWAQNVPNAQGAVLACMRGDGAIIAGFGPACVLGGPASGVGGPGGTWSNMRVIVDGVTVLVPYAPTYAGLDLFGVSQAVIKSFSYMCLALAGSATSTAWPPYLSGTSNPSPWQTFGYRTPTTGNNDQNDLDRMTVYGAYHPVIFTDHFTAGSVKSIFCFSGATAAPDTGAGNAHHCSIASLSVEECSVALYYPTDGLYTGSPSSLAVTVGSLHVETADTIISDTSDSLYGEVRAEMLSLTGRIAGGKDGAANIRLVWDFQPPGVVGSPPAVPASTVALTNTFWRDATVYLTSGGAAVSAIAVDGTATGLALGTTGTVAVRVPSGHSITLTYASTEPTWMWVLE